MLVERMGDAGAETITRPNVQAPVIKNLIENKPGELLLVQVEWMFELQSLAITPGVSLRLAPTVLEPVSIGNGEFT